MLLKLKLMIVIVVFLGKVFVIMNCFGVMVGCGFIKGFSIGVKGVVEMVVVGVGFIVCGVWILLIVFVLGVGGC